MIVGRPETRIVNEAHAGITGVPVAKCSELARYLEATHPDDRPAQACLQQRLEAGQIDHYSLEKRYIHPDSGVRWTLMSVRYFREPTSPEIQELSTVIDITEQRRTHEALREGEDHFRLLNQIVEATRPLSDPEQIMAVMARMLGEHLRASRCAYADVEQDGDQFTILHDYTNNCPSTVGHYHLALFGPRAVELLHRGETLIIRNVDTELTPSEGGDMFNAIGIKAIITCPLIKNGRLRAMMAVHQCTPRDWNAAEIAMVQEIVERCWATIERRTAEEKLRKSEGLLRMAVNIARLGGWAVDLPEWRLTWSDEVCAIHERSPGAVPAREQMFDFYTSESREIIHAALETCAQQGTPFNVELRLTTGPGRDVWVRCIGEAERNSVGTIIRVNGAFQDISARKQADIELEQAHTKLLVVTRQAGMAEFATGILHNVGNVLNSVNVASTCVGDTIRKSKAPNLAKVVNLLREHDSNLGEFLSSDSKGRQLPGYLANLADQLATEQSEALRELTHLQKNIEHIREIITSQQALARTSGAAEPLDLTELVEDAIRMNLNDAARRGLEVIKDFSAVPNVIARKHQVLQILVNLLSNAKQSCEATVGTQKRITVGVSQQNDRVCLVVTDTGVGIPAENLSRIFTHGFTTKKDGHGFGLHSAAAAAAEMNGALTVQSKGIGFGCTFTLELPCVRSLAEQPTLAK